MEQPIPADAELVDRLLAGDEAAFATLVDRHHGQLLRLARIFVADPASAEEVVQDTWLGVVNGLKSFERRSTLKTWIFRILVNRAKTRGQRDRRFVPLQSLAGSDPADEPAVDPERFDAHGHWSLPPRNWREDTPEGALLRRETQACLEQAIAGLPAGQRAVLTLRDLEGLAAEEVCNVLELSETNQRVLLHRARSRLRKALETHLGRK